MHPNLAFRWEDRDAIRALVREIGFGALFATTPDGPRVAHVPVVWNGAEALAFHLARGNALTRHLDGATALFTLIAADAYISPDWYQMGPDQVPTWNYVAVELEGRVERLSREALIAQVDALSHEQESRLAPKPEWTRDKANPVMIDRMLDAVVGFRLEVQAWRATRKLGQHRPEAARTAADALEAQGRRAMAHWMREGGA
ncbi:MAG: FMN-binding negative transcriptional regulator [Pseudomonadota bacterium]